MATIIKIDTSSKAAKAFLDFVRTLPFVKIEESNIVEEPVARYNAETEKAIEEYRKGKTEKLSLSEFRDQLY